MPGDAAAHIKSNVSVFVHLLVFDGVFRLPLIHTALKLTDS